ncbi:MAG: AEC family transporter [Acholeplasmataceae bacterium]|jgi:predicted permease|nr:AEC family transporter [Acholeplasmataceae bacterium]
MLDTFLFAANAILPIVVIILLGYLLRRIRFIDEHFVNVLNKYVFRIGLPALLFYNVYNIESVSDIKFGVIGFSVAMMLILFCLGLLTIPLMIKDPNQKGVILQVIVRSNFALIGIPLAQTLGGLEGIAVVALLSAFTIPLANILSVVSLNMYQMNDQGERISAKKMMINILTNPLILGVFAGLLALVLRGLITPQGGTPLFTIKEDARFIYDSIRLISVTASPMALIALGGQFELSVVKPLIKQISLGVIWRIVLVPAAALGLAYYFESKIPGMEFAYAGLIALFGTPVAVSSAIMVHEMGGDEKLAGQLVIWSSIFSIFTLFAIIMIFRSIGAF